MKKSEMPVLFSVIISVVLSATSVWAVEAGKVEINPLRKATPAEKALKDLERVKKINNDLAIKHFSALIQKNPKEALSYARRGKAYAGNKEYDKALSDYDTSISLDANQKEAYIGRAVARFMKKDFNGSWEDVHKAESLGGEFWPAFKDSLKKESGRDK